MNRSDRTATDNMSRNELFARLACLAATVFICIWMVYGMSIVTVAFLTSPLGQPTLAFKLGTAPVVLATIVGFVAVCDAAYRGLLSLFGLKPIYE